MNLRLITLLFFILTSVVCVSLKAYCGRQLLWWTIGVCVLDEKLLHLATPCLEVKAGHGFGQGYAVLRSPMDKSHVILVPTAPIDGIEAPALRRPDAPNFLAEAWATRRLALPKGRPALPADDIALAINSKRGRTQDQLHIHIDCLRRDVKAKLDATQFPSAGHWTLVQLDDSGPYAAISLPGALEAYNAVDLSAKHLKLQPEEMQNMTVAVTTRRLDDPKTEFLLLARKDRFKENAELLLDHDCSSY